MRKYIVLWVFVFILSTNLKIAFGAEEPPLSKPSTEVSDTSSVTEEGPAHSQPTAEPTETSSGAREPAISKPSMEPTEVPSGLSTTGITSKPGASEGEKAPMKNRSTTVPEFSLPEVVITGENELTIGAKRLERKENDVTLGSRDLTGINRALNDLPGLQKTLTALSTDEAGPSRDTSFILHAGGGTPGTYGGWGLFGQEFKAFQYILSGNYSTWGGQPTNGGSDGDTKYGYGVTAQVRPSSGLRFLFTRDFQKTDAELPYQGSIRELNSGVDLNGLMDWKLAEDAHMVVKVSNQETSLNYWNQTAQSNTIEELEGQFKMTFENIDPFLDNFSLELGGRKANSDFSLSITGAYDWEWLGLQSQIKMDEKMTLLAKVQGQMGNGLPLPSKAFPMVEMLYRAFENTQLSAYWKTDRYVESFFRTFMGTEHVSAGLDFPAPTEVTGEWGGRLTQKFSERISGSLSASTAQIQNYHQWTDIGTSTPLYIQDYSTLTLVQMTKVGATVQWNFAKDWQAAGTYEWIQGTNSSGTSQNLTALPTSRGVFSLYRGDETLETRLEIQALSDRQAFENMQGTLPAFVTVGFNAAYHFNRQFSLWFNGDNLLGQTYYVQPGYLESQVHLRGGIEVIF